MNVAHFHVAFRQLDLPGATAHGSVYKGDLDHAVDNSGDSVGLVADWLAFECWRRAHSPAAGGRCGRFDHQPRNWATSCLVCVCLCYLW